MSDCKHERVETAPVDFKEGFYDMRYCYDCGLPVREIELQAKIEALALSLITQSKAGVILNEKIKDLEERYKGMCAVAQDGWQKLDKLKKEQQI